MRKRNKLLSSKVIKAAFGAPIEDAQEQQQRKHSMGDPNIGHINDNTKSKQGTETQQQTS